MIIVQIGACQANDDLTEIIGDIQPDKLILVEPMTLHNEKIIECYRWVENLYIENIAIIPQKNDSGNIIFYYHINDAPLYEVANTKKEHILKHGNHVGDPEGIREIHVPALTMAGVRKRLELSDSEDSGTGTNGTWLEPVRNSPFFTDAGFSTIGDRVFLKFGCPFSDSKCNPR
jgi:hypothetical protein